MVEFALILPLLALLLVMAVDFGRVFFGWVAVHNAARIGANEAARQAPMWADGGTDDGYYDRIARDLEALNCDADTNNDGSLDETDIAAPVFSNLVDTASPYEVGDRVTVTIECDFSFITPLAGLIVGDPLPISATSTFTVFGGTILGIPIAAEPPVAACSLAGTNEVPDLVGMSVAAARVTWSEAGFSGAFSPAPGPDDGDTVLTQNTSPPSTPGDCIGVDSTVTVTSDPPEECVAPEFPVPNLIGLSVGDARTAWEADFTGTFSAGGASDTQVVTSQTVSGGAPVGACADETASVTVGTAAAATPAPASCEMVQVIGDTPAAAETKFRTQGFTGPFSTKPSNKPTWKVKDQSLIGGQTYACTASLEVGVENK
jgi:hypothetical protein